MIFALPGAMVREQNNSSQTAKSFIPAFEWDTEHNNGNRMFEIHNYATEMKNGPDIDRTSVDSHKRIITKKVEEN